MKCKDTTNSPHCTNCGKCSKPIRKQVSIKNGKLEVITINEGDEE